MEMVMRRSTRSEVASAAWLLAICIAALSLTAHAGPPATIVAYPSITLDGTNLGSAIATRSAAPTILFDNATQIYHLWVQVQDETAPGNTYPELYPLRIAGFVHAVSADGINFTSTGALSFSGNPFGSTIYGSTFGEPPWIYPKAVFWNGRFKLLLWTFNDYIGPYPPAFGDYNYNISVNDIGTDPNNRALAHEGPLGAVPANGIAGQTAGVYGIVNGNIYYDNNSLLGRAAITQGAPVVFPAAANTGPWQTTATNGGGTDLLAPLGLIACQFPGGTGYVHNDARVIDNGDATLGLFYTVRNCDGTRKYKQVWYMESADDGVSWSAPVGIFPNPNAVTIDGLGTSATRFWSLGDVVVARGKRVVYFNAYDSNGNLLIGGNPPKAQPVATAVPLLSAWHLALLGALLGLIALVMPARKPRA